MRYKHIIFDLDGTLINTKTAVIKTWLFTLKEYHYDYRQEEIQAVLGLTIPNTLRKLGAVTDHLFAEKWMENYRLFADEAVFFDGIPDVLAALKSFGYHLGIVTSRCKTEYERYFSGFQLESLFDCIVCADETRQHKPKPEPLQKYAELTGASLSSCIYIGDMPTDISCANNAGVSSGLVSWNASQTVCPAAEQVDYLFRTPIDLLDLLLS